MRNMQRGINLFSLSIALAVVAVVAAASAPAYQRNTRQWAVARSAQGLVAGLHLARSSAAARSLPVAVSQTDAPGHCGTTSSASAGWQLFVENTITTPPRFDAADALLQAHTLPGTVLLRATRPAVTYWPTARAATTATFVLCDRRNLAPARVVIVSQTGRPRLGTRLADGTLPDCTHG